MKFDADTLRYMNFFDKITKLHPKNFFPFGDTLVFVVDEGKAGLAIGKGGKNIKELSGKLKKHVKIISYSDDIFEIIKSFLLPARVVDISEADGVVSLRLQTTAQRRDLLTDKQAKLRMLEGLVKEYKVDLKEIRVL